jgi:hypothetical protein
MNQITPDIAIDNLDKASALVAGTRADHIGLQESVRVIREALIELHGFKCPAASTAAPEAKQ